ncbi:hypothetical protein [Endozoicomonas sp.]|uniref:hypothetical protein n=1 Tax=Endozoicomonas sp. TaxID=1892382 RepID=UPI003AF63FC7
MADHELQPAVIPPRVRYLSTVVEVATPKTGQSDKDTPQFTFDYPDPETKSTIFYSELQHAESEDHIDEGNAA